jgi:hypothetical protein
VKIRGRPEQIAKCHNLILAKIAPRDGGITAAVQLPQPPQPQWAMQQAQQQQWAMQQAQQQQQWGGHLGVQQAQQQQWAMQQAQQQQWAMQQAQLQQWGARPGQPDGMDMGSG